MFTFKFTAITTGEQIVTVSAKAKTAQEARRKIRKTKAGKSLRSLLLEGCEV